MNTGALIFAFDNQETDYVAMAVWSAQNIRRHLNIPTSIVTDRPIDHAVFDQVIVTTAKSGGSRYFEDYAANVTWHNAGRVDAYDLTPYNQTLVLDADYVVASDQLKFVLNATQNFLCHKDAYTLAGGTALDSLNKFGDYDLPMWWATVMMFRKSNQAQYIFDCMHMIRENWQHYRDVYQINNKTYRNDFALSIALGIVNGHTLTVDEIPWPLMSSMPEHNLTKLSQDSFQLQYKCNQGKPYEIMFAGMDFHAMGKKNLGEIVAADR